jgi:diadenylate cyclase
VVIIEGRIKAASAYLPLTTNPSLSRAYGTRHRAAIGITEESDAVAIVVSEERGVVSLAEGGRISSGLDAKGLERALHRALGSGRNDGTEPARGEPVVAAGPSDA